MRRFVVPVLPLLTFVVLMALCVILPGISPGDDRIGDTGLEKKQEETTETPGERAVSKLTESSKQPAQEGTDEPRYKTAGEIVNSIGMTFVYIPPGTFMMGSPPDEPGRDHDEIQHRVTLTKGFYMQTTEVTQRQWTTIIGYNQSNFKACGDDCPVEQVSWNEAQEFIQKLNKLEETDLYRLPTEAEWEYACRAQTASPFSFGRCVTSDQANFNGNDPLEGCPKGIYREKTVHVGSFSPNDWGLYDMHGNVWEWCQDWYGKYPSHHVIDPVGPSTGTHKVLRGGRWSLGARFCRSANRFKDLPENWVNSLGFRLVRMAEEPPVHGGTPHGVKPSPEAETH